MDALELRVTAKGDSYEFSYREKRKGGAPTDENGDGAWCVLGEVDAKEMTERDFTGTMFGIYATEEGDDLPDAERSWVTFRGYGVDA